MAVLQGTHHGFELGIKAELEVDSDRSDLNGEQRRRLGDGQREEARTGRCGEGFWDLRFFLINLRQ